MNGAAAERASGSTLLYAYGALTAFREPPASAARIEELPDAARAALRPLEAGERLPGTRFVVVRLLGQGGMGEVYEVEHSELGRRFALKVLHRDHRGRLDLAARMRDEARSIGRLRHRSLTEVFDLGVTDCGRPYFAMELLEGRDLRAELTRAGVVGVRAALALVAQALSALSVAHAAGIVHRDIKLENLFLCDDGALKLLDFGVAKLLYSAASLTAPDALVGTPRTMAPEQCASGPIDPRADIYAMGLVLYELVAGRGPFDELRGQREALRFAHCERQPPPPSRVAPQPIPPAVEQLILRAIAKAPERRFQTAADMETAVRSLLDVEAARPAPPFPLRAPAARAHEVEPTEPDAPPSGGRRAPDAKPEARPSSAAGRSPGRPGGALAVRRRPSPRPGLRAMRPPRRAPDAARAGAFGLCALAALAVASAALGLALAQRWPASEGPSAVAPKAEAHRRAAVR